MSDVSDIFITDIAINVTRDCYAGIVLENCNGDEIKGSKIISNNLRYTVSLSISNSNDTTADNLDTSNVENGVFATESNLFTMIESNISLSEDTGVAIFVFNNTCAISQSYPMETRPFIWRTVSWLR